MDFLIFNYAKHAYHTISFGRQVFIIQHCIKIKHMRKKARVWKNMLIIRFQYMEKIKLSTWAEKQLSDPEIQRSQPRLC